MLKLGFGITGSFCSMDDMLFVLKELSQDYDIEVFMTSHVQSMDTRFYDHDTLLSRVQDIVPKAIHTTIQEAEIYGPKVKLDLVLIYPCDATTLNKLDLGINDNCVTMLVKSSLRNQTPIVLGVYSNDILSGSGVHLMSLFHRKHYYFVPMYQDNYLQKPNSLIACKEKVKATLTAAKQSRQYQPFFQGYKEM